MQIGLLLVMSTGILGCVAPRPLYRLQPLAENTLWIYGKEYVESSNDSFAVAVAYDRTVNDYLVFQVEIENRTGSAVLVSPERFHYTTLKRAPAFDTVDPVYAVDPEAKLEQLDKALSRENARHASALAADITFTLLDIFAEIVTDTDDNTDELAYHRNYEIENDNKHERTVSNLKEIRDSWEFDTLRKTTLLPEQKVQGLVYFPAQETAQRIRILLPIAGWTATFTFEQNKITVK